MLSTTDIVDKGDSLIEFNKLSDMIAKQKAELNRI
jgi:hypothetical protein